jgi:hypothetical protein
MSSSATGRWVRRFARATAVENGIEALKILWYKSRVRFCSQVSAENRGANLGHQPRPLANLGHRLEHQPAHYSLTYHQ